MNNNKKLIAVIAGVCTIVLTALVFLFLYDNSSEQYRTYRSYMEKHELPALNEDAAGEDAAVICGHFSKGSTDRPFGYLDKVEVMAIVRGYCPEYVDVAAWSS